MARAWRAVLGRTIFEMKSHCDEFVTGAGRAGHVVKPSRFFRRIVIRSE